MQLVFSAEAEADLEEIGDFIAGDNPSRAASFTRSLRAACVGLCDHPERFPVLRVSASQTLRHRSLSPYRIIYGIRTDVVFIVRIVHGARDLDSLLPPD